jgi:triosephosphate isomerase
VAHSLAKSLAPSSPKSAAPHVEVGHAERRTLFGETDTVVAAKTQAAFRNGLIPILCVGEPTRTDPIAAAEMCIGQVLSAAVRGSDGPAGQVIIAYEPFWAIGASQPAPSAYVADVCQRVRIALADQLPDFALLYGGSAGPGLLTALGANVDGLFLGRSPTTREQLPTCSPKLPCPAGQGRTGEPDHEPADGIP